MSEYNTLHPKEAKKLEFKQLKKKLLKITLMIVYHYFFNKYKFLDTLSRDGNKIIKRSLNFLILMVILNSI